MAYATRDDLVLAYGEDAVSRVSTRAEDPDGSHTVARALDHAAAQIDARLSVRFTLPAPASAVLTAIAVDLAMTRMATTADLITETLQRREDKARADLRSIAEGGMNLGLPSAGPSDRPKPILGPGGEKLFTRDGLRSI